VSGEPDAARLAHRPALDGVRALAFLAVFWNHAKATEGRYAWGAMGVQVFFALSGFLITRILVQTESNRLGTDLKRFYLRRTLRIFPLYYGMLALVGVLRGWVHPGWTLTYTDNIQIYFSHGFDEVLAHFWTLCVEEQFYLLYPLIFWLTPVRFRLTLIVGLIAGSKGFQLYAHQNLAMPWSRLLLPYCGEYLLWGALAGLVDLKVGSNGAKGGRSSVLIGAPLLILGWNLHERRLPWVAPLIQDGLAVSALGIGSMLVVFGVWRTRDRWIVEPLSIGPLAALGRISYGAYAFHLPVLRLRWLDEIPFAFMIPKPFGDLALTIGLAALSWRYFEAPINRQKDRLAPAARPRVFRTDDPPRSA